jgi:hypothetical protein
MGVTRRASPERLSNATTVSKGDRSASMNVRAPNTTETVITAPTVRSVASRWISEKRAESRR